MRWTKQNRTDESKREKRVVILMWCNVTWVRKARQGIYSEGRKSLASSLLHLTNMKQVMYCTVLFRAVVQVVSVHYWQKVVHMSHLRPNPTCLLGDSHALLVPSSCSWRGGGRGSDGARFRESYDRHGWLDALQLVLQCDEKREREKKGVVTYVVKMTLNVLSITRLKNASAQTTTKTTA